MALKCKVLSAISNSLFLINNLFTYLTVTRKEKIIKGKKEWKGGSKIAGTKVMKWISGLGISCKQYGAPRASPPKHTHRVPDASLPKVFYLIYFLSLLFMIFKACLSKKEKEKLSSINYGIVERRKLNLYLTTFPSRLLPMHLF